jgi:histidinol-phosphate aminotransferase
MATPSRQHAWAAPVPHGGPDEHGVARFDFSTNGNASGPLPSVARAVARADRRRYPDSSYRALSERLAAWHGVDAARIVVGGSASELIHRLTRVAAVAAGARRVRLPSPGYGDYAAAARLAGLATAVRRASADATQQRRQPRNRGASAARPHSVPSAGALYWITEPMNPTGSTLGHALAAEIVRATDAGAIVALDLAYQPLRLDGLSLPPQADAAWQLWSPNKACGLTGVRAAYAVAPRGGEAMAHALRAHAPSWVAGADGVAMLAAFATPAAQDELRQRLPRLQAWRGALAAVLRASGWQVRDSDSVTPFFVAQAPAGIDPAALRASGIQLRSTDDMGLPGWLRLSAQPPAALRALREACRRCTGEPAR